VVGRVAIALAFGLELGGGFADQAEDAADYVAYYEFLWLRGDELQAHGADSFQEVVDLVAFEVGENAEVELGCCDRTLL